MNLEEQLRQKFIEVDLLNHQYYEYLWDKFIKPFNVVKDDIVTVTNNINSDEIIGKITYLPYGRFHINIHVLIDNNYTQKFEPNSYSHNKTQKAIGYTEYKTLSDNEKSNYRGNTNLRSILQTYILLPSLLYNIKKVT